jgi:NAD(P)-dependent dehydrogenase (short-subunit alcohol dehydrogenase family)
MTSDRSGRAEVALVTGSVGGLGHACCSALAARGTHVVAADLDEAGAQRLAEELRSGGAGASAVGLDVRDREAVEAVVASAAEEHGGLDVVVNLAGMLRNQVLVKIEDEDFDLVMAVHLKGTLNTMRAAVPVMRAGGYGRIVNTSSVAARGSIAGSSYGAAKGAIEGLTRSAAIEVARYGITVNCIAPGLINAGMFLTVDKDYQESVRARIPIGRLGDPEEVASCVTFLASREASYVTGQTLVICGGLSLGF